MDTRQTRALASLAADRLVLVGDVILAEVLQGFANEARFDRALQALKELPQAEMVGPDIAVAAARNYCRLRGKGVTPRGTIDVIIATFCIEKNHLLLHADRDVKAMKEHLGLKTA